MNLLHPGVLIFTKMKRWVHYATRPNTRPQSTSKRKSDEEDLSFLVYWMVEHQMTIDFERYAGKPKEELLSYLGVYLREFKRDVEFCNTVRSIVKEEDVNDEAWALLYV
ncbi:hypothetical protein B0H16DRAFT_1323163 [Mycena metata]|uniref:Uncharacterized protein n=1 Tax=Mycena metata TaxID=1033252 RepID=A0AAD7N2P6_9AGAR|nr:hypothetical protein B0H16DRAFT_1323163 [Mycena metata]